MDRARGAICLAMSISVSMGLTGSCAYLEDCRLTCNGAAEGIGAWSISCVVEAAQPFRIACAQKRPATAIGVADHAIGFFRFRRLHPSANQWPKQFASLN